MSFKRTRNYLLLLFCTFMLFNCSNMWGGKKPVLLLDKEELEEVQKAEEMRRSMNEKSEVTAFGVEPNPDFKIVSVDDSRYLTVTEVDDFYDLKDPTTGEYVEQAVPFNNQCNDVNHTLKTDRTKTVEISGIHVTIEKGHENDIYEKYNCIDAAAHWISNMHIYADTLIIKSEFKLPATNVKIYARKLIFEGEGCINTTPSPFINPAKSASEASKEEDKNGFHGCDAGDIEVYIDDFETDNPDKDRFVMNGSEGQDAGHGQDGDSYEDDTKFSTKNDDGKIIYMHSYTSPYLENFSTGEIIYVYSHPNYGQSGYYQRPSVTFEFPKESDPEYENQKEHWPANGGNAIPPGVPGKGGNGGILTSNKDLKAYCKLKANAGEAGKMAPNTLGGKAQEPRIAYKIWQTSGVSSSYNYEIHYSQDGKSCQAKNNVPGKPGIFKKIVNEPKIWLNPYSIKMVVQHTRDAYLNGHIDYARIVFEKYQNLIPDFEIDPAVLNTNPEDREEMENRWDANKYTKMSSDWKTELGELKNEIAIELAKIANDRDYFNNPAGYVPVLSFEGNLALFKSEYELAIRTIYYSKMILDKDLALKDQIKNMKELIGIYRGKLTEHQTAYNSASKNIGALETKVGTIENSEDIAIAKYNAITKRLMEIAKKKAEDAKKMPFWKKAAKVVSVATQSCPVFQPTMGGVGKGIDAAIALEEGDTWEAVKKIPSIAKGFNFDKSYQQAQTWIDKNASNLTLENFYKEQVPSCFTSGYNDEWSLFEQFDIFNPDHKSSMDNKQLLDILKGYKNKCVDLYQVIKPMKNNLNKLRKTFNSVQISDKDIKREFDKLIAVDANYKEVTDYISNLRNEKAEFQKQLTETLNTLVSSSAGILHCKLVIKSFAETRLNHLDKRIDNKAMVYLKEVKKRSEDRLIYYYYLLRKSYEYRTLKSFTASVNSAIKGYDMHGFMNTKFSAIVKNTPEINAIQFLADQYKIMLSDVTNSILVKDNNINHDWELTYELDSAIIEKLNKGDIAVLNIVDNGWFPKKEEGLKIIGIEITKMVIEKKDETKPLKQGLLDIYFKHPGISKIARNGKIYRFRHESKNEQKELNEYVWSSRYNILTGQMAYSTLAKSTQSMLNNLLNLNGDTMLFARYGAMANLILTRGNTFDANNANIKSAEVKVCYEYITKNSDQRDVNLFVALQDESAPAKIIRTNDLSPFFEISKEDISKHKDGYGAVKRFYNSSDGSVSIRAPKYYGCYQFTGFIGRDGNPINAALTSDEQSTTITLNLDKDYDVYAQYKEIIAYEVDENGNPVYQVDENGNQILDKDGNPIRFRKSAFDIFGANYVDGYIDTDFDNLPDHWEMEHFGNLNSTGEGDNDGDGLSNQKEYELGIDPTLTDSDGDKIPDKVEVDYGFDPAQNLQELSPEEYDKLVIKDDKKNIIWTPTDHDGDGIPNSIEFGKGELDDEEKAALEQAIAANPLDSDGDGMPDVWEITYQLKANDASDATEDPDKDGIPNLEEYKRGLNPLKGSDPTIWEYIFNDDDSTGEETVGDEAELEKMVALNPTDTDGDGMPDVWEDHFGLNKNDASDANKDLDGDGLNNFTEYNFMLDPKRKDNYSPLPCKSNSVLNLKWPNHCTGHCD